MKNPYRSSQLKRLSKRSGFYRVFIYVVKVPVYLGWLLLQFIPGGSGKKLEKFLALVLMPFRAVAQMVFHWAKTRNWKQLLFASPLLIVLAWMLSSLFMVNNMHDEKLYGDYRASIFNAIGKNDFKQTEYLAGKLLTVPFYKKDEQFLYVAMIAAHQNNNMPRRDTLLQRLTEELNYAPAYLWHANLLLASPTSNQNLPKVIEYIEKAIKFSDNPDPIRVRLARMHRAQRRHELALNVLQEVENPTPESLLLLAELHLLASDKIGAKRVASDLLKLLDSEHPDMGRHMDQRVEALAMLADLKGFSYEVSLSMNKVRAYLEKRTSAYPDDKLALSRLSRVYILICKELFWSGNKEKRQKSLEYLEKSVATGVVPDYIGSVVLTLINEGSKDSLSKEEITNALVMGNGVALAHLLLGISAWEKESMEAAYFHIRIAHAIEPEMLTVLRIVAQDVAQGDQHGNVHAASMALVYVPLWRRTIELLDMITNIDAERLEKPLYAKCAILANRQRWGEVVALVEPKFDQISEEYRRAFTVLMYRAHTELSNRQKAKKYLNILSKKNTAN